MSTSTSILNKNHLQQINDRAITNFKTQKFKFPNNDLENNRINDDYDVMQNNNTIQINNNNNKKCINKIWRIDCILILIILMLIGFLLHLFYSDKIHLFNSYNNLNNSSKNNDKSAINNNQRNFSTNFLKLDLNNSTHQRLIVNNSLMNDHLFIININNNNNNNNQTSTYNNSENNNNNDLPTTFKNERLISLLEPDTIKLTTMTTLSPTTTIKPSSSELSSLLPLIMNNPNYSYDDVHLPSQLDENINNHEMSEENHHQQQFTAISHNYPADNYADDNAKYILEIVKNGLGLKTIPDITKANISQEEYVAKYTEYLERVRARQQREYSEYKNDDFLENFESPLEFMTVNHNSSDSYDFRIKRSLQNSSIINHENVDSGREMKIRNPANSMFIRFPLNLDDFMNSAASVEEANIRLLLATNPSMSPQRHSNKQKNHHRNHHHHHHLHVNRNKKKLMEEHKMKKQQPQQQKRNILNMKVFQLIEPKGRVWLDGKKIEIDLDDTLNDETITQWLQFDVTTAVEGWISGKYANLGLEIQCDNCYRLGARIIDDLSKVDDDDKRFDDGLGPVLNIIGRKGAHSEKRTKQHQHQQKSGRKPRKTDCYKENQRCCRHNMEVVLKEIKGFEFIIEPKKFDAGYCKGRCPPRYNPAHHHALLQSLIWKKDHNRAPKPCCAPSKLAELEVLHYDEKDPTKLKTTTWAGMRVLECACS